MLKTNELLDLCKQRGITLATAESCTGGLVASEIVSVPGSSDVFVSGLITYSNKSKSELLGVPSSLIASFGAVSIPVANQMALGATRVTGASCAVSITGVAGPGSSDSKPEGRVCFAVAMGSIIVRSTCVEFGALGRNPVRVRSASEAIDLLFLAVKNQR